MAAMGPAGPWDRARIVAALRKETGLERILAEEIARDVERTIIRARLDSITASLVRELVNAALLERGLEEVSRKHSRLGLPVFDILKRIADSEKTSDLTKEIGEEVISQLTTYQMFPAKAVDLYREHILYIHDAGTIHLPRSRRIHLSDLRTEGESPETAARRILAHRATVNHHLTVHLRYRDHWRRLERPGFRPPDSAIDLRSLGYSHRACFQR